MKKLNILFVCSVLFLFLGCLSKRVVNKIKIKNNIPTLYINNKPLEKLIFAGAATGQPVEVSKEWTAIDYSGFCSSNTKDAFIQINIASGKGNIDIKSVQLFEKELSKPRKLILETKFIGNGWKKNWKLLDLKKVGVTSKLQEDYLHISIPKRLDFPWDIQLASKKLKIKQGNEYYVKIILKSSANAWPVTSYLMRMNPLLFYASSGKNMFLETSKLVSNTGIKIISTYLTFPWNENFKESDFNEVLTYINKIIKNTPKSKLLIRFGVEPPAWWRKKYPDELLTWEDGKTGRAVCVASEKWRNEVQVYITRVITFLEKNWSKKIIGYLPCAQSTGEWYYPIFINKKSGAMNFSKAFLTAYRKYLIKKYISIDKLNIEWHSAFKTFQEIKIPSGKERKIANLGIFRNPVSQKKIIDFSKYQQVAMSEALNLVVQTIKDASYNKKLVFAFYGYLFEHSGLGDGAVATGHLNLAWILKNSNIDGIVDIISYSDRAVTGTGSLMTPVESIFAHKKILYTEDDSRTYLSAKNAGCYRLEDFNKTKWALGRNLMRSLVHNAYSWKFDLYGTGWLQNKPLWNYLKNIEYNFQKYAQKPFLSDIAVIVDEKSLLYVKSGIELTKPLLYDMRYVINRMGTGSASWWLLDDLLNGIVPAHKMTIFLNTFYLTKEQRIRISKYFEQKGGTAVWLFAPGYLTPEGPSLNAMEELTGFKFSKLSKNENSVLLNKQNWLAKDFNRKIIYPFSSVSPIFAVEKNKSVSTLGYFAQSKKGAISEIERNGYKSIFISSNKLTPKLLSVIAKKAGIHSYASSGNIVITNGKILSITATKESDITVYLPQKSFVKNINDSVISSDKVNKFTSKYMKGETKFYIINTN